jgi:chaperonin GroES
MIYPLFTQLQIIIEKAETMTSSGIILAGKEDEKLERATVVTVGPDVMAIKPGDTILFKAYSSDNIMLDGQEIAFVKEEDVLAIYEART